MGQRRAAQSSPFDFVPTLALTSPSCCCCCCGPGVRPEPGYSWDSDYPGCGGPGRGCAFSPCLLPLEITRPRRSPPRGLRLGLLLGPDCGLIGLCNRYAARFAFAAPHTAPCTATAPPINVHFLLHLFCTAPPNRPNAMASRVQFFFSLHRFTRAACRALHMLRGWRNTRW